LVLFPELCSSGYDLAHREKYASALGEGGFERLSSLARGNHIALGASVLELWQGKFYNTFALFDDQGQCRAVYRKTHLFNLMQERDWLSAGDTFEQVEMPWGKTGLSICYDLRFPEMMRQHALQGARLVLLVAEWPARRIAHWQTLLRARALDNQLFIAGCNCVGMSGEEMFGGHSMIVDPWGQTIVEGNEQETLLTAEIDLDMVDEIRRSFPVLDDRRTDLYGSV
jgi:predicted amidohydrolase